MNSGKLFHCWGRSEGTEERQRGPSSSLWLFPHTSKELLERRAFSERSVCATGSNPTGGLTSRFTKVSLALGMGNAWELSRQLGHFLPLRRVRFDHASFLKLFSFEHVVFRKKSHIHKHSHKERTRRSEPYRSGSQVCHLNARLGTSPKLHRASVSSSVKWGQFRPQLYYSKNHNN